MKTRVLVVAALLCATIPLAAVPAIAADQEAVSCAVAVEETIISVSVTTSTVDFGTLRTGAGVTGTSGEYVVGNTGNVDEDILVRGTNASNDTSQTWTLSALSGVEEFRVDQSTGNMEVVTLATTPQYADSWLRGCPPHAGVPMVLELQMPTASSGFGVFRFDVIYTAVAAGP